MRGDDAFARLDNTHRRIEEELAALERAAEAMDEAALRDAIAFFGRAAKRHHDDEEASLFPRLAHVAPLAPVIEALTSEHREHARACGDLERALDARDEAGVKAHAARVRDLYRAHIDREERELFPAARAALDAAARDAIAREMEARRGGGGGGGGGRRRG